MMEINPCHCNCRELACRFAADVSSTNNYIAPTKSKHPPSDLLVSQHHLHHLLWAKARGLDDHRQVPLERPGQPHHLSGRDRGLRDLLLQARRRILR